MNLVFTQQLSFGGSPKPEFSFVKGRSGDSYKSFIFLESTTPVSFGNVCTNAVSSTNKLTSYSIFCKIIPFNYDIPNVISQSFRKLIYTYEPKTTNSLQNFI